MRIMHWTRGLGTAVVLARSLAAPSVQVPLGGKQPGGVAPESHEEIGERRPIHGRFLHITDMHPDKFYEVYSSTSADKACHRGQGPAGIYGAETSACDSPFSLINKTLDWIEAELKDKIDFVVWTGDTARHDNDEEIPRNAKQVIGSNEFLVNKMYEVFGKHNGDEDDEDPNNDFIIPIIPNLGNNDVLPHNVMVEGPNQWTRTYSRLWRQFIPEEQKHQFEQGGWFYVEVIPNKLAVFSINTLFFFSKNGALDGCASPKMPGYQQMEWLRIQLQFMRERGVKAILSGHVPPIRQDAKKLWEETCWQKYTLWLRQYRDVIVGSIYGHFNFDHFLLQDFKDIRKSTKKGRMRYYSAVGISSDDADENNMHATVSDDYWISLRKAWSRLPSPPESSSLLGEIDSTNDSESHRVCDKGQASSPLTKGGKKKGKKKEKMEEYLEKIGGPYAERYAASFISASVVPNLFPTIRVYEYNISGLENSKSIKVDAPPRLTLPDPRLDDDSIMTRKKNKKWKFVVPDPPSKSSPPGPAYSPQSLSLLRFTQYFANLTRINNDFTAMREPEPSSTGDFIPLKWKEGKHKGKTPHNKDHTPHPKKFKYEVHYDTRDDEVYRLKDLTMPSLLDLAQRIGSFVPEETLLLPDDSDMTANGIEASKKKHKKKNNKDKDKHRKQNEVWYTFIRRAFVETKSQEEIEEDFG